MLTGAGADVHARDPKGFAALALAAHSCYSSPEVVRTLLDSGAHLEARVDGDGRTPLMLAACTDTDRVNWNKDSQPEIVRALLAAGADVRAVDHEGRTALELARGGLRSGARKRQKRIVELLSAA